MPSLVSLDSSTACEAGCAQAVSHGMFKQQAAFASENKEAVAAAAREEKEEQEGVICLVCRQQHNEGAPLMLLGFAQHVHGVPLGLFLDLFVCGVVAQSFLTTIISAVVSSALSLAGPACGAGPHSGVDTSPGPFGCQRQVPARAEEGVPLQLPSLMGTCSG